MKRYSTRDVARRLGIGFTSINRYITAKKIPAPPLIEVGSVSARLWTEDDVERVRKLLANIANGRKTRYQKLKTKGVPARVPVLRKKRRTKKKKA